MKETFAILDAVLISIGGGGALILALSSWLGKIYSEKYNLFLRTIDRYAPF